MGVLELKIVECGNTSLDYELALSGHPDRIATSAQPSRTTGILRATPSTST